MPRRKLFHIYGGIYHIMIRGNNRQNIFLDEEDRNHFLSLIQDGLKRFSHLFHGYCLMDNHAHLILQVKDTPPTIFQMVGYFAAGAGLQIRKMLRSLPLLTLPLDKWK